MTFQNKSFWLQSNTGNLTDGEMVYNDLLRSERKRGHERCMDTAELELFCNKKQAINPIENMPVSRMSDINMATLENTSSLQANSRQFNRLFGCELRRTVNPFDMNIPSLGNRAVNAERKDFGWQFSNACSGAISMPHGIGDPASSLDYIGFGKVNELHYNNGTVAMEHSFKNGDLVPTPIKNQNTIQFFPLTCDDKDETTISVGPTFNKVEENDDTSNKGDITFNFMDQSFNNGNEGILSRGNFFHKGSSNFMSLGQPFGSADGNIIPMDHAYDKGAEVFTFMNCNNDNLNKNSIVVGPSYNKAYETFSSEVDGEIRLMGPTNCEANTDIAPSAAVSDKVDSNIPSMRQSSYKGENSTILFGGLNIEPETSSSGKSSNNLLSNPSLAQVLEQVSQEGFGESNADPVVISSPKAGSKINSAAKNKMEKTSKLVYPNNFPANVKSLLSTGMLDGIPVKYYSWSRDKSLRGVIQGTKYKCSCKECNLNKSLNAYEFERHAGFKTKHPNNYIFFENGKSIYAVVQELRSTPVEKLFEVIQNVTGSPINQKNFSSWKESFEAATRELQRIYGKDEGTMHSNNKD